MNPTLSSAYRNLFRAVKRAFKETVNTLKQNIKAYAYMMKGESKRRESLRVERYMKEVV